MTRLLPILLEVGDEARDEHEVDRPVAGDLVGDAQVAAARVPDRRSRWRRSNRWPSSRSRAARRWGGQTEGRVLTKDAQLELLERRTGFDPERFDVRPSSALERVEGVGLPAAAIEREHQLAAQTVVKRVLRDEPLELRHHLGVPAERKVGVDAILDRRQT